MILKGLHSVVLTKKAVGEVMQRPFKFQTIDQALNWTREAVSRSRSHILSSSRILTCYYVTLLRYNALLLLLFAYLLAIIHNATLLFSTRLHIYMPHF